MLRKGSTALRGRVPRRSVEGFGNTTPHHTTPSTTPAPHTHHTTPHLVRGSASLAQSPWSAVTSYGSAHHHRHPGNARAGGE